MKLGCSIPFDISFASHSASFTSDLRPGTFLKCAGFTRQSSKPSSSSTFHTGIQYTPVDSIAISTISFSRSHAASSCSSRVVAPKLGAQHAGAGQLVVQEALRAEAAEQALDDAVLEVEVHDLAVEAAGVTKHHGSRRLGTRNASRVAAQVGCTCSPCHVVTAAPV
jgi:hypothetical protein